MGSYPDEFPFGIMEVVELLHLRVRRQQANSVYVDCPFCGDRRGRMNCQFRQKCLAVQSLRRTWRNAGAICKIESHDDL